MNSGPIGRTCHGLSLLSIAVAVMTLVAAIWCGFDNWTWDVLFSSVVVFVGSRTIAALDHTAGGNAAPRSAV